MTTTLNYGGWVWISNSTGTTTFKILCEEQPELGLDDLSLGTVDYAGDGHYGWSFQQRKREVTIKSIFFISQANYEAFIDFIEDNQNTGFLLMVQTKTGADASGTTYYSGYFWDWDGQNHCVLPCRWTKPKGLRKLYGGDTGVWEIGQITFRQTGAAQ